MITLKDIQAILDTYKKERPWWRRWFGWLSDGIGYQKEVRILKNLLDKEKDPAAPKSDASLQKPVELYDLAMILHQYKTDKAEAIKEEKSADEIELEHVSDAETLVEPDIFSSKNTDTKTAEENVFLSLHAEFSKAVGEPLQKRMEDSRQEPTALNNFVEYLHPLSQATPLLEVFQERKHSSTEKRNEIFISAVKNIHDVSGGHNKLQQQLRHLSLPQRMEHFSRLLPLSVNQRISALEEIRGEYGGNWKMSREAHEEYLSLLKLADVENNSRDAEKIGMAMLTLRHHKPHAQSSPQHYITKEDMQNLMKYDPRKFSQNAKAISEILIPWTGSKSIEGLPPLHLKVIRVGCLYPAGGPALFDSLITLVKNNELSEDEKNTTLDKLGTLAEQRQLDSKKTKDIIATAKKSAADVTPPESESESDSENDDKHEDKHPRGYKP